MNKYVYTVYYQEWEELFIYGIYDNPRQAVYTKNDLIVTGRFIGDTETMFIGRYILNEIPYQLDTKEEKDRK